MSDTTPSNSAAFPPNVTNPNVVGSPNVPGSQQIREFNDRGTLWLLEDPANLRDLLQLLAPDLAARLDLSRAERINRSFIPADLQKEESDLIFRIAYRADDEQAGTDVLIFVLLEHQSKPDPLMGLRLLSYMLQLWEVLRREAQDANVPASQVRLSPVVPIVFYTGQEMWEAVPGVASLMDMPPELARFVPAWDTLFLNLGRTAPADLTRFSSAVGYALRVLQAEREPFAELEQVLNAALAGLEGLAEAQAGQWVRAAWYLALLVFHRRNSQESPVLLQTVQERARASKFHERTEADTIMTTLAQEAEARGEARAAARMTTLAQEAEARGEARAEARAAARMTTLAQEIEARAEARMTMLAQEAEVRGETRATRQAVAAVLFTRFGVIPAPVEQALAAADLPTLQTWLQRAAQAATLEDVGVR